MNASPRTLPLYAIIAVAALSGALAGSVVEHAASAAVIAAPVLSTDPADEALKSSLQTLLKYVKVDSGGNVTIDGTNVSIKGSAVTVQGSALTSIKGAIVTIN